MIPRLKSIDSKIYQVNRKIELRYLNPVNVETERIRFMRSTSYEPFFRYPECRLDIEDMQRKLREIEFKDTLMDKIFKAKAQELHDFLSLIRSIGTFHFTSESIKIFGKPTPKLLEKARFVCEKVHGKIFEPRSTVTSRRALTEFRQLIRDLGFDWEVRGEDTMARAMVIPGRKLFLVQRDTHFTQRQIRRLIAHEIFTHILRAEFGLLQPYRIFSTGLAKYESTEEGLALYKERLVGVLDAKTIKGYAGRALAVDVGLKSSFRRTFEYLTQYYSRQKSWELALRVKRGLSDTSHKGAFTKDYLYLSGYLDVEKFVQRSGDIRLLHYGKVGLRDLQVLKFVPELKSPDDLKDKHLNIPSQFRRLIW